MRVLHLISSAGWYGAENAVVNLAAASRSLGCDCRVGVLRNVRNSHVEVAEASQARGIPAEIFDCRGRLDFSAAGGLRRYLRGEGIELLHVHGYKAATYACAASAGIRVPLVATCHTGVERPELTWPLRLYGALERRLLAHMRRVVGVSPAIAEELRARGIEPRRVAMVANGVDSARFDGPRRGFDELPAGARVVGMVGRLIREKGPYCLLDAARRVLDRVPDAYFVFVGDGPERDALLQRAAELGVAGRVRMAGVRGDMPGVYASLEVFTLPSFSEGMPMTVLEAMAAGVPVVATRVGAIPELLQPFGAPFLCAPGDAEGLAAALSRALLDPEEARRVAALARARQRQEYSSEAMARRYLDVYRDARMEARG